MGETPLMIFTLCLQAAIGTMLFITLGKYIYKDHVFKWAGFAAAILSVIGIFASLIHLGRPFFALNSLFNLGSSWLSREVLLSGIFAGIAVAYVLIQHFKPNQAILIQALRWIGSVIGILAVFTMAKVYTTTSVPVWHGINTFIDFFATSVMIGAIIFLAVSLKELKAENKKIFGVMVLIAAIIQVSAAVPYSIALGLNGLAAQNSVKILSTMSGVIGLKWLLILGGAAVLMWSANQQVIKKEVISAANTMYIAGIALIVGEIIGRYIFYAAIVVTNVGLS